MTPTEVRKLCPESEAAFTRKVLQLAKLRGWRSMHIRPGRTKDGWRTTIQGDGQGWPDLFLVRDFTAMAIELKTDKGKLTVDQSNWLHALANAGIVARIWRPSDWPLIEEALY